MNEKQKKQNLSDLKIPFSAQFDAQKKLIGHIVPILAGHSQNTLDFKGSAVYISRGDRRYLVTANHVIADYPLPEILVFNEIGKASSISFRNLYTVSNDFTDIALFELQDELPAFEPFSYSNLAEVDSEENVFHLVGFPGSKVSRPRPARNTLIFAYYFVVSRPISGAEQYFKNFDPRANMIFEFKKKNILLGNGKVGNFPDPNGKSGGAVFELFFSCENKFLDYTLVGIMTQWNPSLKRFIRCTKAGIVKAMIDKTFI